MLALLADAATIVTGLAVLFAVVPYFQSRKQRRQENDQWYVERYWHLQDRKRPTKHWNGSITVVVPFAVRYAELKLCEDELDARAHGWVTNDSWSVWKGSIYAHRDDEMMMDIVERTPRLELVRLREYLKTGVDPIEVGQWRQFWRGLR